MADTLGANDEADLLQQSARYAMLSDHLTDKLCRTPAGVLTQLFVRNGPVPHDLYCGVLPEHLRRAIDELGIVDTRASLTFGQVSVTPFSSLYLASDQLFTIDESGDIDLTPRGDLVMPPHSSTLTLLEFARGDGGGGSLVDMGSGCGALGLSLARSYDLVRMVDANPRAAAYSSLNAHINDISADVIVDDVTTGNLSAPVGSLTLFNAPTTVPYRNDVNEYGFMTPRAALESIVSSFPEEGKCRALVFAVIEIPRRCRSIQDIVAEWLTDLPVTQLAVNRIHHSAAYVAPQAISQGTIDPQCLLLRHGGDAPLLLRYLRERGIHEVVPVVVSVSV
ncbi:methyltransferase [Micromonospora sp. NPDC049051]|uniref:methyltransferase n=1 Tax=Micromonospora sp. NPDC049051 TaxID=3364264 RepID=UPI003711D092